MDTPYHAMEDAKTDNYGGVMVISGPFVRLRTYCFGKTTSLRLNAYDDAAISKEILRYLKTREMPEGPETVCQRAAALIQQTEKDDLMDHRLAMQAYCQYGLNGYGDIMEALAIERLFRLEVAYRDASYAQYERGPVDLLFWVAPVFRRDVSRVLAWVRENAGFELKLTYEAMAHEVLRVQHANIEANFRTRTLLDSGLTTHDSKVNKLRSAAALLKHPRTFLSAAAGTQAEMANWDKLGSWLLKGRLGQGTASSDGAGTDEGGV